MKRYLIFIVVLVLAAAGKANAQDGGNPLNYSSIALQLNNPVAGSAFTDPLPTVALSGSTYGYLDNPASAALYGDSFFNFSIQHSDLSHETSYLGITRDADKKRTALGNLNFAYKFPTRQGSFVVGGGYNLQNNTMRTNQINARNNDNTITDSFNNPASDYYDLAFETYAIDYATTDSSSTESIFRIGFAQFPGITQDATITQSVNLGDYSVFLGTEFQENLYVGFSAGLTAGSYTYRRDFLELDDLNDYNTDFIEGSDISSILTHDEIDAEVFGLNLRTGLIYSFARHFNIGLSYTLPTRLHISEYYYSSIETNLDDNSAPFFYDLDGDFRYSVKNPGRLNAGFAIDNLAGFSFSAAAEYVDYSKIQIDLVSGEDFDYLEERALREDQNAINNEIGTIYKEVVNLKTGIQYQMDGFEIGAGYAFLPGRSRDFDASRNVFTGGIGFKLTNEITLNLKGQYSFWDDQSVLYSYSPVPGQMHHQSVTESLNQYSFSAGLKFLF